MIPVQTKDGTCLLYAVANCFQDLDILKHEGDHIPATYYQVSEILKEEGYNSRLNAMIQSYTLFNVPYDFLKDVITRSVARHGTLPKNGYIPFIVSVMLKGYDSEEKLHAVSLLAKGNKYFLIDPREEGITEIDIDDLFERYEYVTALHCFGPEDKMSAFTDTLNFLP